jgi:hypothetical protein
MAPKEIEYLPFGRYKGKPIHEVPSSYLLWAAENWNEDRPFVAAVVKACDDEWQYREKTNTHIEDD